LWQTRACALLYIGHGWSVGGGVVAIVGGFGCHRHRHRHRHRQVIPLLFTRFFGLAWPGFVMVVFKLCFGSFVSFGSLGSLYK
jgi:hypothetical protein